MVSLCDAIANRGECGGRQIEEYVQANYSGKLHGAYGASQGGLMLTELLTRNKIEIQKVKSLSKVTSEPRVLDFQFIDFVVVVVISQSTRNILVHF